MLRPANVYSCVFGLAVALHGSAAFAQSSSSTCMAMGPDMVHCDTMNMGPPQPGYDGGAALGRGIGALIARSREDSFRKKVGKLLADGDCRGASRLALESGRLELGQSIIAACRSDSALTRVQN